MQTPVRHFSSGRSSSSYKAKTRILPNLYDSWDNPLPPDDDQLSPSLAPSSTPSSLAPTGTAPPTSLDESCNICVNKGCTFCDASSHFARGPSVCVCEGLNDGNYGGCADFSWNSSPTTECEHHVGDRIRKVPLVIWPLIGLASMLILGLFWNSCCRAHAGAFLGNPGGACGLGDLDGNDSNNFRGDSTVLGASSACNSVSGNCFSDPELV